jgi:gluconate kinase
VKRAIKAAKITIKSNTTLAEARETLKDLHKEIREYSESSQESRKSWLQQVAKAIVNNPNTADKEVIETKASKEYKRLIHIEDQRHSARIIKFVNRQNRTTPQSSP